MKKLIAILLVLACMLAMGACSLGNGAGNGVTPPDDTPITPSSNDEVQKILDELSELIRTSTPSQSKVTTVTGTKDVSLESELTITMGELSGKEAALYVHEYEEFNDLGATEIKTVTRETKEYVEGMGLRIDGGVWEDQPNFVRRLTPYRMNLDAEILQSVRTNEDNTVVSFIVPLESASDVFNNFDAKTIASMTSDIAVRIETDGSSVTAMNITYDMKSVTNMENPTVEIKAHYSYDLQSITLLK